MLHLDATDPGPMMGVAIGAVLATMGGLIGGQIEKYISSQITEEIPGVQRFTTRWISENG